jgi:hypothetical protein
LLPDRFGKGPKAINLKLLDGDEAQGGGAPEGDDAGDGDDD